MNLLENGNASTGTMEGWTYFNCLAEDYFVVGPNGYMHQTITDFPSFVAYKQFTVKADFDYRIKLNVEVQVYIRITMYFDKDYKEVIIPLRPEFREQANSLWRTLESTVELDYNPISLTFAIENNTNQDLKVTNLELKRQLSPVEEAIERMPSYDNIPIIIHGKDKDKPLLGVDK